MGWIAFDKLPCGTKASSESAYTHMAGNTCAIDVYGWLHAIAASDAVRFVVHRDITFVLKTIRSRIQLMRRVACTPIFCFDGRRMPMKAATDADRNSARHASLEAAMQLSQVG